MTDQFGCKKIPRFVEDMVRTKRHNVPTTHFHHVGPLHEVIGDASWAVEDLRIITGSIDALLPSGLGSP
ncbi:hypothetical protein A0H81_06261 [Grifola frondosa]|uniref:Uncharacterized protein n=1 Tax=Grifola frondosa TaxID=5627 RepID=A0A1C7MB25_GRIFR|nr:hypothetical protein A0H81_06261 [Grifola frondosa]